MIGSRYNKFVATTLRYHKLTCSQADNMADDHLRKLRSRGKECYGGSFTQASSMASAVDVDMEKCGGGDTWRNEQEKQRNLDNKQEVLINMKQRTKTEEELQKNSSEIQKALAFQVKKEDENKFQLQSPRMRRKNLQAKLFIKLIIQETKKVDKQFDIQSNNAVMAAITKCEDDDDGVSLYGMVRAD